MTALNTNTSGAAAKVWLEAAETVGGTGLDWFRDLLDARTLGDAQDVHAFYATRQMQNVMDCLYAVPAKLAAAYVDKQTRNAPRRSARRVRG